MESFLSKFIAYFVSRDFKFFAADFDPQQVGRASLLARLCVSAVSGLEFGVLGGIFFGQSSIATDANLKANLEGFAKFGEVVGIYLKYGQPVIVIVIDGENLNEEQLLGRFMLLQQATQKMRDFSMRIVGGRLPSRTLAFTVFKSHTKAVHFKESLSIECKKFNFFNKVWVLPFTVDLERKRVFPYGGLPVTEFKGELMEKVLFD